MQVLKKVLCVALAALMLVVCVGCSTPAVAMTVDGRDYATGEYIAYMFNVYQNLFSENMYYYQYYNKDIWSETFPYGEDEENQETLGAADYIIKTAQDSIVRARLVEKMMEENGIKLSAEDEAELQKELKEYAESDLLELGISKANFEKMFRSYFYNEEALFYGLYKEGGKRAVSEADIKKYITENYVSFQMFSIALTDTSDTELSAEVKTAITDYLNTYLAMYEKDGDFDAVYKAYCAAIDKGVTLKDKDGKTLAMLSWDESDVVVTLPTETDETKDTADTDAAANSKARTVDSTTTTTSTTAATTTTTAAASDSASDSASGDALQVTRACTRETNDASLFDEDLVAALRKIDEGKAAVTTYADGGTTATAALILRYNPFEGKDAVTVKDQTENVLFYSKFEEFNKEMRTEMKKLDVSVNERAVKMCRPEYFDPDWEKGQTTTTSTTTTTKLTVPSSTTTTATTTTTSGATTTTTTTTTSGATTTTTTTTAATK